MTYRVVVLPRAKLQIQAQAQWWAKHRSPEQAARWLAGIEQEISQLGEAPLRHGFARENDSFSFDLRQMLFGVGSHPTHRIVFSIEGDEILVHAVRHHAQDDITSDDI